MVLKTAKSNESKKPDTPQIEIVNKGKTNEYVNGMELTFDSYFTLYGTVEIIIGNKKILYNNNAEDFKQHRIFPVPVHSEILKPYESIKIFVWNPLTDDYIFLAVNVDIDDVAGISTLSGQAIDNDAILSEISGGAGDKSDTHDIFPYKIYRDETKEFLINTKGRQNMLLTMASSNVSPPQIINIPVVENTSNSPVLEQTQDTFGYTPNESVHTIEYEYHLSSQVSELEIKRRINQTGAWEKMIVSVWDPLRRYSSGAHADWKSLTAGTFVRFSYEKTRYEGYCPSGKKVTRPGYYCDLKTWTRHSQPERPIPVPAFLLDSKPDPLSFKINSDVDNSPDTTSATKGSYPGRGPFRFPNIDFQLEREWYFVTKYLDSFRDVTLNDGTQLGSAVFGSFVDRYLLVDGQNNQNKQLRCNFNSMAFSQDTISAVMAFQLRRILKYQRTRWIRWMHGHPYKKIIVSDWTLFTLNETTYDYKSATVTLRVSISFEIEVSDDVNFTSYRKIKDVSANGQITLNFSERYMRIKRIVTGTRLILSTGTSNGSRTATLPYPDITSDYSASNMIDLQSHGGTASLYFELKGVNGQWFNILDSSQLGAVTQGESKLIRYGIAGIPPSQSRFKAVLQVTNSLQTGVTIDLVA